MRKALLIAALLATTALSTHASAQTILSGTASLVITDYPGLGPADYPCHMAIDDAGNCIVLLINGVDFSGCTVQFEWLAGFVGGIPVSMWVFCPPYSGFFRLNVR